ncbi:hypothetical protein ES707_10305 [subsurface metagenome]
MEWLYLILLGAALLMLPLILTSYLLLTALTIYVVRKLFPFAWGIAEWVTNWRNLLPFVLFMLSTMVVTVLLLIGAYLFATNVHWIGFLFLLLCLLILYISATILWGGLGLAIILWIVRLSHWGYARFRTLFERTSPPSRLPAYRSRRRLPARQPIKNPPPPVPPTGEKANAKADEKQKIKAKAGEETEAYYESEFKRLLGEAKAKTKTKAKRVKIGAKKAKAKTKAEEEIKAYYESEYQRFLAEAKARAQPEQRAEVEAEVEAEAEAKAQPEQGAEAKARPRLRRRRRLKQGK